MTSVIRRLEHSNGEWVELREYKGFREKRTNYYIDWRPLTSAYPDINAYAQDLKSFGFQEVQPFADLGGGEQLTLPTTVPDTGKRSCICDMTTLMRTGCKCGGS